jgi:retron-type reverse transcriptase
MNIIKIISQDLALSEPELVKILKTAPHRYKVFFIAKRNNSGYRKIAQPSKEIKYLQKLTSKLFVDQLPVHGACTAYVKKSGIKKNALMHSQNQYLLKMDFKNFFPSIRISDFSIHMRKFCPAITDETNLQILLKLFFWAEYRKKELVLSIGAPTSPLISNTILFDFDTIISDRCKSIGVRYTRYADDLTFSTNKKGVLFDLPKTVESSLNKISYPKLKINQSKTVFISKKMNRHITGIVITNDGLISLGRKRKKYIKSLVYRFKLDVLDNDEIQSLKGYLSFANDIEPNFLERLKIKYGNNILSNIYKYEKKQS